MMDLDFLSISSSDRAGLCRVCTTGPGFTVNVKQQSQQCLSQVCVSLSSLIY